MTDMNFRAILPLAIPKMNWPVSLGIKLLKMMFFLKSFVTFYVVISKYVIILKLNIMIFFHLNTGKQQQQRIKQGYIEDVYAYPQSKRFIDNDIG